MKKTPQPKTAAPPLAAASQPAVTYQPPTPEPKKPSEYTLLARIMERASDNERLLMHEILTDCTTTGLPVAEATLRASSHALGLGLFVEDITEFAEDFRGLTQVTLHRGWLYRFLNLLFRRVNARDDLTPEDLMHMAEMYLLELEGNVAVAKQVIKEHPTAVANEIRQAVTAQPELLALS